MDLADLDQVTGAILIKQGKGRKPRMVYLGKKSRKAVRAYLRHRKGVEPALWVTDDQNDRLTYWGLRGVVRRRATQAGVEPPELHAFRRRLCPGNAAGRGGRVQPARADGTR